MSLEYVSTKFAAHFFPSSHVMNLNCVRNANSLKSIECVSNRLRNSFAKESRTTLKEEIRNFSRTVSDTGKFKVLSTSSNNF